MQHMSREPLGGAWFRNLVVDVEALVQVGVLEPWGIRFRVLDYGRLPEQARQRMRTVGVGPAGERLVTFSGS
jgi:hypothetical protein